MKIYSKDIIVELSCNGACLCDLWYQDVSMVVVNKDPHLIKDYEGLWIGPSSGRIKDGLIKVDNKRLRLDLNENKNHLHGGNDNISSEVFKVLFKVDNIIVFNIKKFYKYYDSIFDIDIIYRVEDNVLYIETYYSSSNTSYLNLTNHTYFNLGDSSNINHCLLFNGYKCFNDKDHLIINISKELEYFSLVLDNELVNNYYYITNGLVYYNDKYQLRIKTSLPGMVIYNAYYKHYIGTCFETSYVNNDHHTKQLGRVRSNKIYHHWTSYHFSKRHH